MAVLALSVSMLAFLSVGDGFGEDGGDLVGGEGEAGADGGEGGGKLRVVFADVLCGGKEVVVQACSCPVRSPAHTGCTGVSLSLLLPAPGPLLLFFLP